MKRRSFLAGLLGLPAVPLAAKAVLDESEPAVEGDWNYATARPIDPPKTKWVDEEVCLNSPAKPARRARLEDFVDAGDPAWEKKMRADCFREAFGLKKTQ